MGPSKGPTLITHTHIPSESGLAVAIDGGNSKTEVVVLARDRGGLSEHVRVIGDGSGAGPRAVEAAVSAIMREHGIDASRVQRVSAAIAGLDFPGDQVGHLAALAAVFPEAEITVVGDAIAVLEAGGGAGNALAIVCGAGLNAVARGPHGLATVPALGWVSGDWGGGDELGREAVRAAARAEDGRGPSTELLELVLTETGTVNTVELARAIRDGMVPMRQVGALAATVARAAARGDAVAAELVTRVAREALLLADVVAGRAWEGATVPPGTPATVAGGLFSDDGFRTAVFDGLRDRGFHPRPLEFRPVDGLVRALLERDGPAAPPDTRTPGTRAPADRTAAADRTPPSRHRGKDPR